MTSIAMSATGLGIAFVQARTILTDIKERIDDYRKAPGTFAMLSANTNFLESQFDKMEKLLSEFPSALPSEISTTCDETFATVRDTLESTVETMDQSFSAAFAGSNRRLDRIKSKALRVFRATKLENETKIVEANINNSLNLIRQMVLAMGNALKIQDLEGQDAGLSKPLPKPKTYAPPPKTKWSVPPPKPKPCTPFPKPQSSVPRPKPKNDTIAVGSNDENASNQILQQALALATDSSTLGTDLCALGTGSGTLATDSCSLGSDSCTF